MSLDNIEDGHEYVIAKLKGLKKVSAPDNFEYRVMSKLKSPAENSSGTKRKLFWGIIPLFIFLAVVGILLFSYLPVKYKDPAVQKSQPVINPSQKISNSLNHSWKDGFKANKNLIPSTGHSEEGGAVNKQMTDSGSKSRDSMINKGKQNSPGKSKLPKNR